MESVIWNSAVGPETRESGLCPNDVLSLLRSFLAHKFALLGLIILRSRPLPSSPRLYSREERVDARLLKCRFGAENGSLLNNVSPKVEASLSQRVDLNTRNFEDGTPVTGYTER
jgi:hypothetical protein